VAAAAGREARAPHVVLPIFSPSTTFESDELRPSSSLAAHLQTINFVVHIYERKKWVFNAM
jgi:hypothetical protein